VGEVAAMLGTPLMPWQAHVADVALEVDPGSGLLAYREIVLTVPRQSGKTTLLLAAMTHRALGFEQRQRILYTAQTRNDARKKWEDEHVAVLEASPLRAMFRVRRSNGAEAIRWRNGSMHGVTSSTEKAGHGETLDLGVIDEAFAHEDDRLEQALKPTMVTRPQPQLWVVSTAGTLKSTYLREKVEAGRFAAEAGITAGVAYFEWSAPPEADPGDLATWYGCMPALGRTVREDAIAADYQTMKLDEFRRAYLNQWPSETPEEWQVIPKAAWRALADPGSQATEPLAFAADVNPDRTWASIGVAGRRADGNLHVEITSADDGSLDHRRGTAWVVPRLKQLAERWRPCAVVIAPSGPANSLIPEAEAAGLELAKPSVADIAGACGAFYDATGANPDVDEPASLRHLDQPDLNVALAGALTRDLGDRWLWTRKGITVDITPLVAVTLAGWGLAVRGHLTDEQPAFAATWR
jgi:terminase large subunit-like protein